MKKTTVLGFLLTLAISASAQSVGTRPTALGRGVPPNAHPGPTATNSTVHVPPVAKVPPVSVHGKKK
jgi:hypothetical protein